MGDAAIVLAVVLRTYAIKYNGMYALYKGGRADKPQQGVIAASTRLSTAVRSAQSSQPVSEGTWILVAFLAS